MSAQDGQVAVLWRGRVKWAGHGNLKNVCVRVRERER